MAAVGPTGSSWKLCDSFVLWIPCAGEGLLLFEMAVQTRACNNNRQIKTKQAAAAAASTTGSSSSSSSNNNGTNRRAYHRRRNRGKTIPREFLESARFSQSVQSPNSTETLGADSKKSESERDNDTVQVALTTAAATAARASVKTSSSDCAVVPTTQEIKCKKSGKMFQVGVSNGSVSFRSEEKLRKSAKLGLGILSLGFFDGKYAKCAAL